jgi:hypothetical protein
MLVLFLYADPHVTKHVNSNPMIPHNLVHPQQELLDPNQMRANVEQIIGYDALLLG